MGRADILAREQAGQQTGQSELDKIIAQMQESAEKSRLANVGRQQQVEAIFDEIIARYGPGGTYGKGAEAQLARQKVSDVGAGAQRLISSGLYGTEVGGGLETAWESEVGAPARLRLEDIKMERLSQAQIGKAGFMERVEDVYPDYGLMAQLISGAANVPAGAGGAAGGVGGGAMYGTTVQATDPFREMLERSRAEPFEERKPYPTYGGTLSVPYGGYTLSEANETGGAETEPAQTGVRMKSGGWYDPKTGSWSMAQDAKGTRIWYPKGSVAPGGGGGTSRGYGKFPGGGGGTFRGHGYTGGF